MTQNAGIRLWETQKHQGTGLCVGLDPHYSPGSELNAQFYMQFSTGPSAEALKNLFRRITISLDSRFLPVFSKGEMREITISFISGLTNYFLRVIDAAWAQGIRVFKPQAAFYELLAPYGTIVLEILCSHLHELASKPGEKLFLVLDAKRGDIDTTQYPYYSAYLSGPDQEVFAGVNGRFGFDSMTVTTWMGTDVLTPGLSFFAKGKGAIVVTRSSNPSGTTLQDIIAAPNDLLELSEKQQEFAMSVEDWDYLDECLDGGDYTNHEVMLYLTEKFSCRHELNQYGVSPLFSVMGSTVKMSNSFREIRPLGIALIPGFGAQGGKFENVMPLLVETPPLEGHIGILSSSRDHNFPWMKKAGGNGDPMQLESEMARAIDSFRAKEKGAYAAAGATYPF